MDVPVTNCRFIVEGAASADLPLRVLNLFAQQGLAFDRVAVGRKDDRYVLTVEQAVLTWRDRASRIPASARQYCGVFN